LDEVVAVTGIQSIMFELAILEYRSFTSDQSSSVIFQLFTGIDVLRSAKVVSPAGAPTPALHTVFSLGVRLEFDLALLPVAARR
jgi:hypothetical protein